MLLQTLLRFNLQSCNLAKPFSEKVVGFYVHTDMNFVITAREQEGDKAAFAQLRGGTVDAGALEGAPEE